MYSHTLMSIANSRYFVEKEKKFNEEKQKAKIVVPNESNAIILN